MSVTKVPLNPTLEKALANFPKLTLDNESLPHLRQFVASVSTPEAVLVDPEIIHEDKEIPGRAGSNMTLAILKMKSSTATKRPAIYNIHGGGMVCGSRLYNIGWVFPVIKDLDAVVISPEYRLAPEHPHPAPVEDCFAGLKWVSEHASELGIDVDRIMISGGSAGGGLAAGTALLARDRKGPKLVAQCLMYPMIDDRVTVSGKQYVDGDLWSGKMNVTAWGWLLADSDPENVPIFAAPARATDLSGLPEAFIEVGTAEVFRDECVAYATKLWEFGIQCELHVWPGGFHGFDVMAPTHPMSIACLAARLAWVKRVLTE